MSDTAASALTREAIAAVDAGGQLADVLDQPAQIRDASWRVETAGLQETDSAGLVVTGMGGSAIGGSLAAAALGDRASRPILTARGYSLPPAATPDMTVLCVSYSGETEETLASYDAAGALGATRIVATTGGRLAEAARADGVPVIPLPGGFQPRHAIAYMTVIALEVAALTGAGPVVRTELDVAAAQLERLVAEWGPDAAEDSLAKRLARDLAGRVAVVAGAGLTAPIAYRWKTQLNENAKLPAFASELPELDHNELEGWTGAAALGRFAAVLLDDCDLHPRVRRRIALTRELVAPHADGAFVVPSLGETRCERLFSLTLLGDLVSLYLAVLGGVDPGPVATLDAFKARLAQG